MGKGEERRGKKTIGVGIRLFGEEGRACLKRDKIEEMVILLTGEQN